MLLIEKERERGRISEVVRQCSRFVPRTILEQVKQLIGPKVSSRVACKINKQKDFNTRSKDKDQGLSSLWEELVIQKATKRIELSGPRMEQ